MAASTIYFFKLFLLFRLTQNAFKRVNEIVCLLKEVPEWPDENLSSDNL